MPSSAFKDHQSVVVNVHLCQFSIEIRALHLHSYSENSIYNTKIGKQMACCNLVGTLSPLCGLVMVN